MDTIKKIVINAEDYPNSCVRAMKLEPGDEFYISYKEIRFKPGDKYLNYPAIIR